MTRVLGFLAIFLFCFPVRADDKKENSGEIGNRDVGNCYSLEKQIAIGKGLARQVEAQTKIVDDPMIVEYVNRVGQNLARNSEAKVSFTIKVIDSEEVNAVGLPGGFLFVSSGLIRKANTEAELAGFMAHEIARESGRRQSAKLAVIPLMFMGTWPGYGIHQAAVSWFPQASRGRVFSSRKPTGLPWSAYIRRVTIRKHLLISFKELRCAKRRKREALQDSFDASFHG